MVSRNARSIVAQGIGKAGIWSLVILTGACCLLLLHLASGRSAAPKATPAGGAHAIPYAASSVPIQHVIIIMQENRSFDNYFGTYPGAEGFPAGVCVNDPATGECVAPYHNPNDRDNGGPHNYAAYVTDVDNGKMDGFIRESEKGRSHIPDDVMSYHDSREIPNYWTYAQDFVLQDHMFEPNTSASVASHLYMVSEWSALCSQVGSPDFCVNTIVNPGQIYNWTDLTYLLHKYRISWSYYVSTGKEPDTEDGDMGSSQVPQSYLKSGFWNPLPDFETVKEDGELRNIKTSESFFADIQNRTLPAVCWFAPNDADSEHPPNKISSGQAYVTKLINAVMMSPYWDSTAIFVSWDDWGGFYDHVVPPKIDQNGFGFRVPALLISPYARQGYIDKQVLSFDAYNKFIEDVFINSQRLDPATDGRPDPRISVRENAPQLGDLMNDFDFTQQPLQPVILNPYP